MIATLLIAGSVLILALLASTVIGAPSSIGEVAAALVGSPFSSVEAERHGVDLTEVPLERINPLPAETSLITSMRT